MPRPLRVLPERLVEARQKLGWNQSELARRAGVSPPTVSDLEGGKTKQVKFETVQKIAGALGRPIGYLTGGNTEAADTVSYRAVPVISWVQAGKKQIVADPFQPGAADEWEDVSVPASKTTFALRVRGDSMVAPDGSGFPEGTIIIVDPERQAENGSYVVVRFNDHDEATFKRLIIDGPMKILKPLNPAYPTMQITTDAHVSGVVIEATMRRKLI